MAASDKEEILACVNGFLTSISNQKPPFPGANKYILPESYAVLSRSDELIQCTLADLVTSIEEKLAKLYESGAISAEESLVGPGPDIWVGGRLAAVWAGYSFKVDGKEALCGVNAFTLFKREDGWKIGAIADKQWNTGEEPLPYAEKVTPEMMEPSLELCRLLNEERWDEVTSLMLPGSGATYMRFPHTLLMMQWPEFFSRMRAMLEKAKPGYVEQKLMEWEGRICGDMGLIWTPFTVALDGEVKIRGYNIFTMLKRDGKWLISGAQDG